MLTFWILFGETCYMQIYLREITTKNVWLTRENAAFYSRVFTVLIAFSFVNRSTLQLISLTRSAPTSC